MIRGEGGDAVRRCKTHGVDWSSLTYPLRLAVLSQVGDDWHVDERFWSALQQGENLPLHWRPNTLIMQDYSGFSVIQEWRALCQAKQVEMGALPLPVHLVVDHSHRQLSGTGRIRPGITWSWSIPNRKSATGP